MFIKRFLEENMQEALRKINNELGPDAIILTSKRVRRKGIAGFFRPKIVEVVAAYETDKQPVAATAASRPEQRNAGAAPALPETPMRPETPAKDESGDVLAQLGELRNAMREMTDKLKAVSLGAPPCYPDEVQDLYCRLLRNDVQESICAEIAGQIQQIQARKDVEVLSVARQLIQERLGPPAPIKLKQYKQSVVLLTGPTGAGKTTTMAKLAGRLKFTEHMDVGIINTDTYRIGAIEHVRIYSEIMNIPMITAYDAGEMETALQTLADMDIVFVDTAGKSAREDGYQEKLEELIRQSHADEVLLVLSAAANYTACKEVIERYAFLDQFKLVITKLDEISLKGNVLNIVDLAKKPVAYVTVGQNVPEDIQELDAQALANDITHSKVGEP